MRGAGDGRADLRDRAMKWAARLRVAPRAVRVQRMTRKWGSCSTAGIVPLAHDLVLQPPGFRDFVIVHELLHLRVPNHGRLFKALLAAYVPDWRTWEAGRRAGAVGCAEAIPDPGGQLA